mgnify:CR=1 FL=1
MHDPVNSPKHYTSHPSGIDCIQITEHMGFNLGNAIKYIWRADLKNDAVEDLKKAVWYIRREIDRRTKPQKIGWESSQEYLDFCEEIDKATANKVLLKLEIAQAQMEFEAWRTEQATNRNIERMTR